MKRKFWTVLLAFAALLCLCLGLASCGGASAGGNSNAESGDHTGGGSEEKPDEPLPHDHVYGADNLCTVCGDKWEYTEGLEFTPGADGKSYLVSGAGTASGDIVVPFGYQGKFVTGIADSAFENSALTGAELPSSVTFIGKNAFFGSSLTYVTIPASVTAIGDSAFGGCVLLVTVNLADLAAWCNIQFANGTANPLSQAQHLVVGGEEVTELVIPKGVTKVSDYAFYGCDFLSSIVIPDSVTVLGTLVFGDFTVTVVIRFEGTVEQWQELVEGLQLWESGQGNPVDCENGSIDQNGAVTPPPGGQGGEGGEGGGDTPGGEQGGEGEHTHTYSEAWSYDEDFHWHTANCHPAERSEESPHTYENGICTECRFAHQEHTFEYSDETEEGHKGTCSVCNKVITEGHDYVNGTCTKCEYDHVEHAFAYSDKTDTEHKATCSVCGKSETEAHSYTGGVCTDCEYAHQNHTYNDGVCTECHFAHQDHTFEYSNMTDTGHTGTCSVCNKVVTEEHSYDNGVCTKCGYELHVHTYGVDNRCTDCGEELQYTTSGLTFTQSFYHGTYSVAWDKSTLLFNVVIPYGFNNQPVTSIVGSAFKDCSTLRSIEIPSSVTSIGNDAFHTCGALESVTFGGESKLTSIGNYAFDSCHNLTSIKIPAGVTSIGNYAFRNCYRLASLNIPASVTSIGNYAFDSCNSLNAVYITDLAAWCKINFSSSSANPLSYAHHLYLDGQEVTELKIPEDVTAIKAYAFYGCSSLNSIKIPDSVTSIGNNAFYDCSSLKGIEIPAGVTSIGNDAFNGCSSLEKIEVDAENQAYYSEQNCLIEIQTNTLILGCKNSVIPASVTSIGNYAFRNCNSLTSIEIPASVTSIGNYAFRNCNSLASVIFSDESKLTSIGSSAFYGCSSLTCIEVPASVTSIGNYAFLDCNSLENLTFEGESKLTSIGNYALSNCSSLKNIQFKGTVDQWGLIKKSSFWNYESGDYTITCTDGTIDKSGKVTRNSATAVALCPPAPSRGKE